MGKCQCNYLYTGLPSALFKAKLEKEKNPL